MTLYSSTNAAAGFTAFIAAGQFTTAKTITVNLDGSLGTGAGSTRLSSTANGSGVGLVLAPDTGGTGYSTWTINTTTAGQSEYLQLGQGNGTNLNGTAGSGPGSATALIVTGPANVELSSIGTSSGDWASLTSIDLSGAKGAITITGAAANITGGYLTSGSVGFLDPNGPEFNNIAGLLTAGTTPLSLTSFVGSQGTTFVDLSGMDATHINAMKTIKVPASNTSTANTLILPEAVLTQTFPLANEIGFQIIGINGGLRDNTTIDMTNFPLAKELKLYSQQTGAPVSVTIIAVGSFTLDLSGDTGGVADNWTINGAPGVTSFTLIMGSTNHLSTFTDHFVGRTFDNAPEAVSDTIGVLTVSTFSFTLEDNRLPPTSSTIVIGGGPTPSSTLAGPIIFDNSNAPLTLSFTGSADFNVVAASASAGLHMAANTATNGITITGSLQSQNFVIGSSGPDTINSGTGGDVIDPNGGSNASIAATVGDTINLAAGHVGTSIDLYRTTGGIGANGQYVSIPGSITDAADNAQIGWWGLRAGDHPQQFGNASPSDPGLPLANFNAGGVSSSQVVINGFDPTKDVLDFAPGVWGAGATFTSPSPFIPSPFKEVGLLNSGATAPVNPSDATAITTAILRPASALTGLDNGIVVNGDGNVVLFNLLKVDNASALAFILNGISNLGVVNNSMLQFPGMINDFDTVANRASTAFHQLWLYDDNQGNAHIADVEVMEAGFSFAPGTPNPQGLIPVMLDVIASDMVELVGVHAAQLTNANIHFTR